MPYAIAHQLVVIDAHHIAPGQEDASAGGETIARNIARDLIPVRRKSAITPELSLFTRSFRLQLGWSADTSNAIFSGAAEIGISSEDGATFRYTVIGQWSLAGVFDRERPGTVQASRWALVSRTAGWPFSF